MGDAGVREQGRRPPPVIVEVYGPDAARERARAVSALYRCAFGAPPNDEGEREFAHQRAAYACLLCRPGFRLALALAPGDAAAGGPRGIPAGGPSGIPGGGPDGGPVGFAYGAMLAPDTRWWDGMHRPLSTAFTRETGRRTFAIIDMGVLPGHRRRGVGRALHDALLAGCGAERATLSVEPRLAANQRLYREWGWRWVGRLTGAPGDLAEVYDIYLLEDRGLLTDPPAHRP